MFLPALLFAAVVACHPINGICEKPVNADVIVDSVGVNVHLHYDNTVYGNFPLIQGLLKNLGVRHTRDGLIDTNWQPYYQRHVALGQLGIKCLFITGPAESDALLTSWPGRVPGAFEGYEAPNEYDNSGDQHWAATLQSFLPRLYKAVKSNSATSAFPIVGPSLISASDIAPLKNLAPYFDFANMHNYFGGHNPGTAGWGDNGYGSIVYNMNIDQTAWPGKPIWTTETGYTTGPSNPQWIPESVEGKYVPRMVLEQALHGVMRTYIYELIDEGQANAGNDGAFGLARQDGSPKPAYTALKNLTALMADPGPHIQAQPLQFSLAGASPNVHHLLIAKRNGSYYVAFWLEEQNYDGNKHVEIPVKPEAITFTSSQAFSTAQLTTFAPDGSTKTTNLTPAASIPLTATDCVTILQLNGASGSAPGVNAPSRPLGLRGMVTIAVSLLLMHVI